MKYILGVLVVLALVAWVYLDRQADLEEAERVSKLVTRAERHEICKMKFDWLPDEGEKVQIVVNGTEGVVVFVAYNAFEAFGDLWLSDDRVEPNSCDVEGIDVRTSSSRVREEVFEGVVERVVEPYAVVRFKLFELKPLNQD